MRNMEQIKLAIGKQKEALKKKYKVKTLAVFGSYARGEQNLKSDLDILVEFEEPIGLEFVDLAEDLEQIVGNKVDLVSKFAIKSKYFKILKKDLIYV